jgi:polysaccharide export outer membrane protein
LAFTAEEAKSPADFADYLDRMGWARTVAGDKRHLRLPVLPKTHVQEIANPDGSVVPAMNNVLVRAWQKPLALAAVTVVAALTGCHAIDFSAPLVQANLPPETAPPRELAMVSLPEYRIEPPDELSIELLKVVPRSPYRIAAYDVLDIDVGGTMPEEAIRGYFLVEGEGFVTLGPAYGTVHVEGMTLDEATEAVTRHLQKLLERPAVSIHLSRPAETQEVTNSYLVQPDGTVNLRQYGMVRVAGKTVTEARRAVQEQLSQYFDSPCVALEVKHYVSQKYYVIAAGAGIGDNIQMYPITGNETVLDAIARLPGPSKMSSKTMWLARPAPTESGKESVLPVDFVAITQGVTATNYQLMPGDRLYIVDDKLVAGENYLAKLTAPIDRLLGLSNLGTNAAVSAQTMGRGYNLNRRSL